MKDFEELHRIFRKAVMQKAFEDRVPEALRDKFMYEEVSDEEF